MKVSLRRRLYLLLIVLGLCVAWTVVGSSRVQDLVDAERSDVAEQSSWLARAERNMLELPQRITSECMAALLVGCQLQNTGMRRSGWGAPALTTPVWYARLSRPPPGLRSSFGGPSGSGAAGGAAAAAARAAGGGAAAGGGGGLRLAAVVDREVDIGRTSFLQPENEELAEEISNTLKAAGQCRMTRNQE